MCSSVEWERMVSAPRQVLKTENHTKAFCSAVLSATFYRTVVSERRKPQLLLKKLWKVVNWIQRMKSSGTAFSLPNRDISISRVSTKQRVPKSLAHQSDSRNPVSKKPFHIHQTTSSYWKPLLFWVQWAWIEFCIFIVVYKYKKYCIMPLKQWTTFTWVVWEIEKDGDVLNRAKISEMNDRQID